MSRKTEKKERKMRRMMIRNEIEQNENMVYEEVIDTLLKTSFINRFLFAVTILLKRKVRR